MASRTGPASTTSSTRTTGPGFNRRAAESFRVPTLTRKPARPTPRRRCGDHPPVTKDALLQIQAGEERSAPLANSPRSHPAAARHTYPLTCRPSTGSATSRAGPSSRVGRRRRLEPMPPISGVLLALLLLLVGRRCWWRRCRLGGFWLEQLEECLLGLT